MLKAIETAIESKRPLSDIQDRTTYYPYNLPAYHPRIKASTRRN